MNDLIAQLRAFEVDVGKEMVKPTLTLDAADALEQAHKQVNKLKTAIGDAICNLDDIDGASLVAYDLENVLAGRAANETS